jgi:hypothetical protein
MKIFTLLILASLIFGEDWNKYLPLKPETVSDVFIQMDIDLDAATKEILSKEKMGTQTAVDVERAELYLKLRLYIQSRFDLSELERLVYFRKQTLRKEGYSLKESIASDLVINYMLYAKNGNRKTAELCGIEIGLEEMRPYIRGYRKLV